MYVIFPVLFSWILLYYVKYNIWICWNRVTAPISHLRWVAPFILKSDTALSFTYGCDIFTTIDYRHLSAVLENRTLEVLTNISLNKHQGVPDTQSGRLWRKFPYILVLKV